MLPPSTDEPAGQEAPAEPQPPPAASLRASAQERDEVVQRLQMAFAEGRLHDEEFDERLRAALVARTQAELGRLLADLPTVQGTSAASVQPASARSGGGLILAVMGGTERRGRWRVPERCTAVAVMGGCLLDLRAARLSAPVTTLTVVAIMGGVEVIVPPGVRVEMHGLPLMGGWSNHVPEEELVPNAPEVHVHGFALMGGVEVRTRKSRPRS
jgi:hypothetical protein